MTSNYFQNYARTARRLDAAGNEYRRALAERNAAIIEASQWRSGADIADRVGMSKAGVYRILEANRGYAPPSRRKGQHPPPIVVEGVVEGVVDEVVDEP